MTLDQEYQTTISKRNYDTDLVHSPLVRDGCMAYLHEHYPDICTGARFPRIGSTAVPRMEAPCLQQPAINVFS